MGDKKQCLCCAAAPVLCLNLSCFIPESFRESHGYSNKGTLLCCEYESMGELLPETEGEDTEELLLHNMENIKCVMPSVCFKTKYRHGPCICSAALPCDNEVPCACAILGCKLCACDWKGWNSNYSSCYWSTRSKDYGMVDGGAPSVELYGAPSTAIMDNTDISAHPAMDRGARVSRDTPSRIL